MKSADVADLAGATHKNAHQFAGNHLLPLGSGNYRDWTTSQAFAFITYRRLLDIGASPKYALTVARRILKGYVASNLEGLPGNWGAWTGLDRGDDSFIGPLEEVAERFTAEGGWALPLGVWLREVKDRELRA